MSIEQRFRLRREYANNSNLVGLLSIAKYRFIKGSIATNEFNLAEICYYHGRLNLLKELEKFLEENSFIISMQERWSKDLAKELFNIGCKFPHLNENEIQYLENCYCDPKTFELFDIIMFDCNKLARPIKKFDKNLLNIVNTNFSTDLLIAVWDAFLFNEEASDDGTELHVYVRAENRIIRKKYNDIGLGEFCITNPIQSGDFSNMVAKMFGDEDANYFAVQFSIDDDLDFFKENNFYTLNAVDIEYAANVRFIDSVKVEKLKAEISLFWLNKINEYKITIF